VFPKTLLTAGAVLAAAVLAALPGPRQDEATAQASLRLDPVVLSAAEKSEVSRGKIVLRAVASPGLKGKAFEAIGTLPGTLDEVLAVVLDYRHYDAFMPRIERTVVTDEEPLIALVELHLKLPLGLSRRYRLRYTARMGTDGFRVDWVKVPWPEVPPSHTVVDTSGHWLVVRTDDGGLLGLYHVYTDPGRVPLGMKGLALSLSKHDLPKVIEAVRSRLRPPPGTARIKD